MDSKIKKVLAGVAIAGALTVGSAGVAMAADAPAVTDAPAAHVRRHPALRAAVRRGAVKVVADTLGVSPHDVREALKSGQTLRDYTTSLGKDPQAVVDALTNAANARLDRLVANGRISQERADTVKSKLPARIDKLMNHQFGQHAST